MIFKKAKYENNKHPTPVLNHGRKHIYLDQFELRTLFRFVLSVFHRPTQQLPTLDMLVECKQWLDFPIMSYSTLPKWWRKLEFCYKRSIINDLLILSLQLTTLKTRLWQRRFLVNFANFFNLQLYEKRQALSCEFCELFLSATLLKVMLRQRCFLVNFVFFLSL